MSEPTIETLTAELNVLRQTNAELRKKSSDRGDRIKEMVTKQDELTAKLTTAEATVYDMTVGAPLRELAKDASATPALWLGEFSKHFKVEQRDGTLAILTAAGQLAKHDDGTAVEPSWGSVNKMLSANKDAALQELRAITIVSKASGGGAAGARGSADNNRAEQTSAPVAKPVASFGLR